jgi:dolichol-phosphate mannosyltransferase
VNWPLRRIILSVFANWYVRTITGLTVKDVTGGFRCWRREALHRLQPDRIRSRRYAFMVETVFEAARLGLRIAERPIIYVERRVGASKMSATVLAESMMFPWRLVWRNRGRVHARQGDHQS